MNQKILTFILAGICTIAPLGAHAEDVVITVKGMVCSFCAQGITKTFKKDSRVEDVHVDLETKLVTVKTKGDAKIPDEELRQTITDAGYDVLSIARK